VDSQLLELQKEYVASLPARLVPVMASWQCCVDSNYAADLLQEVYRAVHAIAGTSSMLNVTPVNELSNKAQELIHGLMAADDMDAERLLDLGKTLKTLESVILAGKVKAPPINLHG